MTRQKCNPNLIKSPPLPSQKSTAQMEAFPNFLANKLFKWYLHFMQISLKK